MGVSVHVGELVRFLHHAVEVGANDVAVKVADHHQRRVEQALPVAEKLPVSGSKVFELARVSPNKITRVSTPKILNFWVVFDLASRCQTRPLFTIAGW